MTHMSHVVRPIDDLEGVWIQQAPLSIPWRPSENLFANTLTNIWPRNCWRVHPSGVRNEPAIRPYRLPGAIATHYTPWGDKRA